MTKTERKITQEELTEKIGAENLELVLDNVYCAKCGNTTIVGYEKNNVVEQSGDIILRGNCKICGHKVARFLETGEA